MSHLPKTRRSRIAAAGTLALVVALLVAVPAQADNIQNDVVATGNGTITEGGETTVNYSVRNSSAGGSGFSGCDPADGSALRLTINVPDGVTASEPHLDFTTCDTDKPVVFSSDDAGFYEITVSTSDSHGNYNANGATFTLTVNEPEIVVEAPTLTKPVLTLPANITGVEATGPGGAAVDYTASAADQLGAVTPACSPAANATFALGTTTVNCTATNSKGITSGSFTVTVVDTTPPAITVPTADVVGSFGEAISYTASASDLVDGAVDATCVPASGSIFAATFTTVSCDAADSRGNVATTATFRVNARYSWSRMLEQPVNPDGNSTFKAGSTIPLKFRLTGSSAKVSTVQATVQLVKLDGSPNGVEVESASTAAPTTGNLFRYDADADQYVYNLSTKGQAAGDYRVRIDLGDGGGPVDSQRFSLRK